MITEATNGPWWASMALRSAPVLVPFNGESNASATSHPGARTMHATVVRRPVSDGVAVGRSNMVGSSGSPDMPEMALTARLGTGRGYAHRSRGRARGAGV